MITEGINLGKDVDVTPGVSLNRITTGDRGKIRNYVILFGGPDTPLTIGSDFFIGPYCYLNGIAGITIGDRVTLAAGVMLFSDSGPNTSPELQKHFPIEAKPIRIGSDVWIGAGAMILPGVTIGNRCIVGAGSVVKDDVPDGSIVGGIPAKVIRPLD